MMEFSGEKRRHVFLVFKELLHNIVKHADASMVTVAWKIEQNILHLSVSDNGAGIDLELRNKETSSGNGLRNMQMRIERLGGNITWKNETGTHTHIQLPLPKQEKIQ